MLKHELLVGFVAAAVMAAASVTQAANLGDRHLKALGNNCVTCHKETPPSKLPPEKVCYPCHGDLKKIGNRPIGKGKVNPHLNHVEELYCRDCHHMHKKSSNYCSDCHDDAFLGFKVP